MVKVVLDSVALASVPAVTVQFTNFFPSVGGVAWMDTLVPEA